MSEHSQTRVTDAYFVLESVSKCLVERAVDITEWLQQQVQNTNMSFSGKAFTESLRDFVVGCPLNYGVWLLMFRGVVVVVDELSIIWILERPLEPRDNETRKSKQEE